MTQKIREILEKHGVITMNDVKLLYAAITEILDSSPIRLPHLSIPRNVLNMITSYVKYGGEIVIDTLIIDMAEVEADFMHSKETNESIAKRNASDRLVELLRKGIKVTSLDSSAEKHTQSVSPPLFDKYYRTAPIANPKNKSHE